MEMCAGHREALLQNVSLAIVIGARSEVPPKSASACKTVKGDATYRTSPDDGIRVRPMSEPKPDKQKKLRSHRRSSDIRNGSNLLLG